MDLVFPIGDWLLSPLKLPRQILGKTRDAALYLLPETPIMLSIMPPYVGSPAKNFVVMDKKRKWALPIYLDPVLVNVCQRLAHDGAEEFLSERYPLHREIQKKFLENTAWNWQLPLRTYLAVMIAKAYGDRYLARIGGVFSIKLEDLTYLPIDA